MWYLSTLFSQTFSSADSALSASFKAIEAAAIQSQNQMSK